MLQASGSVQVWPESKWPLVSSFTPTPLLDCPHYTSSAEAEEKERCLPGIGHGMLCPYDQHYLPEYGEPYLGFFVLLATDS